MTANVASIPNRELNFAAPPEVAAPRTATTGSAEPSRRAVWVGRILTGLAVLFLVFDATVKVLELGLAVEATAQLGYPVTLVRAIGLVEVVCLIAYLVPRTSVLGAILWTGYLGGAIATHVRIGSPLFSHILFPVYIAALLWAGLWLRSARVRALLP